jgi:hypothetical protein
MRPVLDHTLDGIVEAHRTSTPAASATLVARDLSATA